MLDPNKKVHFISSPAHLQAMEQLERTVMTAQAWLKPALSATPCTVEFEAFLRQLAEANQFLLHGKTR